MSLITLVASIWIIIPAPAYDVWLFSVAASEWSLWIAPAAVVGAVCALFGSKNYKLFFVVIFFNLLTFAFSLYPFFSAFSVARQQGVSLSFERYFAGVFGNDSFNKNENEPKTFTFANVDGSDLKLDVYSPPNNIKNNGAGVIVIHGGSWSAGERGDFPQWNRWLAREGYTVFDIDYRTAPQPNWKAATGDVKCAVLWVKKNAAQFNISADRIALFGRSAGGHLALLAAYSDSEKFASSCNDENDGKVRAVVSLYAPTDLLWAYDNPANERVIDGPEKLRRFLGGNPNQSNEMRERYLLASPVSHVSAKTPPTLLVHGGRDQLVRNENMYFLSRKLEEAKLAHKVLPIPYAQHGFDYNFDGWGAQIVQASLLEFLRENTKP